MRGHTWATNEGAHGQPMRVHMGNGLRLREGAVLHKVQGIMIYAIRVVIFHKNEWVYL